MNIPRRILSLGASLLLGASAMAAPITYNDTLLGNGSFSWIQSGITLSLSAASGGFLTSISAGQFAGAWLGSNVSSSGLYTLTLSQSVTSFELEFDALSSTGPGNPEQISNIGTTPGIAALAYLNQFGTSFSGSTITSTANDGQGTITLTSAVAFNSVTFLHTQNPGQNGFVIERVTIDGAGGSAVPEAGSTVALLGLGLGALVALRRKS